ncbi:hypothetical protein P344_06670 [Spiroplasma mirum ATCC 29335]|uniref:Amidohydrolase-related domain-containing protein n=1 Tax=Spiroplasma mirum ATCC 29335 TaxID=838561 RepID=W0GS70_9MOLU|nr:MULTISPECIES: N-acetylglucosamine-6-phosphate deacetylase [Spiroplasma]AHF61489.1 N-acetylglucosamine-6-phosphate deacetylase [Spiroplasma mirum ATCC 29335]AHI58635.1 hypothetical protein P344_06670 [Spiroplasma mirum ATCC 29335]AKM53528.1 N-acetylglucosamine-6-phosphate deacetylase [Spiroplasma atrichopogonis]
MILKNAKIVLINEIIEKGWIEVEGNLIKSVNKGETNQDGHDLHGLIVMPGFIECHVHGGYGHDFEEGTIAGFDEFAKKITQEGVTKFCQGTVTGSVEKVTKLMAVYGEYMTKHNKGAKALQIGAHLEGPFISHEFKGAHEETLLIKPDIKVMQQFIDASKNNIRVVTYAPELQDGSFTTFLLKNKIIPSMGHSAASFEQVTTEVGRGANHFTHLHNGMSRYEHRKPGMVNAGLFYDEILCELITDGIHNHPDTIREAYKIKGPDHLCIITDAMIAKGLADGPYKLGDLDVIKKGQTVTLLNGTLAGAAATYDFNVRNMYHFTKCSLIDLIKMTSINVAKQLGIYNQTGSIQPNKLADLVVVDNDLNVKMTISEGEIAYNNL